MGWRWGVLAAGLVLTACAARPTPVRIAAPPPPAANLVPPAPTPINAGLSPAATLWHLRTALNVAALACRRADEAALVARYNALLAAHAPALRAAEAAYRGEYQAQGAAGRVRYDADQTRLYNFWGQARGRAGLCAAAGEALTMLQGADDVGLTALAGERLAALDRAFAPPRLEVDARVFVAPAATLLASR